jgi:GDP-4-dehydro-6-deoxy-D-mannose reductase
MRALVTGISGFVGRHLSAELIRAGWEVFGTCLACEGRIEGVSNSHIEIGDIKEKEALSALVKKVCPDAVLHLAALSFVPLSLENPPLAFEVNLTGTLNLYEAILEAGIRPKSLFIGSSDEYGPVDEGRLPITEEFPLNPQNPYACSKAAADLMSLQYFLHKELAIIRVRPFNHIGPGQDEHFVASDFAHQIALIEKGKAPPIIRVGNLEASRDFTDVRDVVKAYRLLLDKGAPGEVYNVASGRDYPIGVLLEKLLALTTAEIRVEKDPDKFRPVDTMHRRGSFEKLERRTGWRPSVSIDDSLRDILDDWRKRTV